MKRVYLSGYRSFELGIFKESDAKIEVIKKVLKERLVSYLEDGLEWVILGGNLGVEQWGSEVVNTLKNEYPELKVAVLLPFEEFGNSWNEKNQTALFEMKQQADYVNTVSHQPYNTPQQLKNHTQFLLSHTDGSLLLYDEEHLGKTDYYYKDARKYQETNNYQLELITMYDLQNSVDF
ncbi:DUF1273 domain-containing protein [Vagococcus intermedius]|uniref:UPF0398 protein OL234_06505 n=1 Tax=Vagococcus intermedius TaxID=2991418 RepID=A0AAF0CTF9_9ENTE|nr:DUF1273 domain-containing protein [Vagococcus intermedius]WEG72635.1 DUF1273 domain-containing protein [Vagococcus intermedius]WEG74720.1 DUF1273 domain-containing protein [Vagococcus intermedius]